MPLPIEEDTDVWAHRHGRWLAVSAHVTRRCQSWSRQMSSKRSWKSWLAGAAVLFLMSAVPAFSQPISRGISITVYESPT
jgi:hypothetical protein